MHITPLFTILISLVSATSIRYDAGYDDPNRSLNVIACSDGINGLEHKYGWSTQGQIASFPNIGASDAIASWNSPNVSWGGKSIYFMAMDVSKDGVVLSTEAMDKLTGGMSVQLGRVDAAVEPADISNCMHP